MDWAAAAGVRFGAAARRFFIGRRVQRFQRHPGRGRGQWLGRRVIGVGRCRRWPGRGRGGGATTCGRARERVCPHAVQHRAPPLQGGGPGVGGGVVGSQGGGRQEEGGGGQQGGGQGGGQRVVLRWEGKKRSVRSPIATPFSTFSLSLSHTCCWPRPAAATTVPRRVGTRVGRRERACMADELSTKKKKRERKTHTPLFPFCATHASACPASSPQCAPPLRARPPGGKCLAGRGRHAGVVFAHRSGDPDRGERGPVGHPARPSQAQWGARGHRIWSRVCQLGAWRGSGTRGRNTQLEPERAAVTRTRAGDAPSFPSLPRPLTSQALRVTANATCARSVAWRDEWARERDVSGGFGGTLSPRPLTPTTPTPHTARPPRPAPAPPAAPACGE